MFDESSRRLLRAAPDLPGLNPTELDELLTEAHVSLATMRTSPPADGMRSLETLDRVRRLASTFEAYVALDLRPDQTRAAAFVAGSAHQVLARAYNRRVDRPTLLSSDAVGAGLSSTLLFLIADRAADAAESAVQLRARGEPRAVRRSLIISIRELARGDLGAIVARNLGEDRIPVDDSREEAADMLFRECAHAVQVLAREALGEVYAEPLDDEVERRLMRVIALTEPQSIEIPGSLEGLVHIQFAGPHHLATLLLRLFRGVRAAMLVRTPVPGGAEAKAWQEWLLPQAKSRPFLWTNHLKAIDTGYLDRGRSMVMTSPTGSGKTTLSVLKIAATLCAGDSVVYLAPTHALVDQVEEDLAGQVGDLSPVSVEDTALAEIGERLPPLSVMTPERCLALLGAAPGLFDDVGLLVFDEFHLIGAGDPDRAPSASSRAIDAMLALLTFIARRGAADLLLLSAMVANGGEIAHWLEEITGRATMIFDDPWKPTRQLRSCVIYDDAEVAKADAAARLLPTKAARGIVPIRPLGLFSLVSGWHPRKPEKLVVRPLTRGAPPLARSSNGVLTANRNAVAAQIAAEHAATGQRVIVFCADARSCGSVAKSVEELLGPADAPLDENQEAMRTAILKDVGSPDAAFDPQGRRATVHHGDLLPLERRLAESLFRARRALDDVPAGLDVIAATSTIAQGLNLPCDVVILAGTDRSAKDDPSGNPRSDLSPHEILNAMGRAGRAAYAATGLAIVVPAKPIRIDPSDLRLGRHQSPLSTVFSSSDACEVILDPLELLLDRVEAAADSDPKVQAMIRRLTAVTEAGETGFDDIVKRSFGYFLARKRNAHNAMAWLNARKAALAHAAAVIQDPPVLDWQHAIAVRNGVPPEMIGRLADALDTAPVDTDATAVWVNWALDIAVQSPRDLGILIREASLNSVFGRAYEGKPRTIATTKAIVSALKAVVGMWCAGRTLIEIEAWLLQFVRDNECLVKKPAAKSANAHRARRFAIRILPDLGFLCGLLTQVDVGKEQETNVSGPPVIDMLQQMVKAGDHNRHQAVFRHMAKSMSRVWCFKECQKLGESFLADPQSHLDIVRGEVERAINIRAFRGLELD